jgi:glutaryl-CoA dehydrogenase
VNCLLRAEAREVERVDSGYRSASERSRARHVSHLRLWTGRSASAICRARLVGDHRLLGLTEPDHGPDPGGMITRARKTAGGCVLRGNKIWITNSPVADVFVVWAKDDPAPSAASS